MSSSWIDIDQGTDEWLGLRKGRVTSSKLGVIMANYGKAFGDPAKKLMVNMAAERVTDIMSPKSTYSNKYIDAGHEFEPVAIKEYERENFVDITKGGYFYTDIRGDSPDGLMGDDYVVEVKSQILTSHYDLIRNPGKYPPQYKYQIQWHLMMSGRPKCLFISYCYEPHCPENKRLYSTIVERDQFLVDKIEFRLKEWEQQIKAVINELKL